MKIICPSDENGFPAHSRLDAIRYRYMSKDAKDLPFTINIFTSKKNNKNVITFEVEYNKECNLNFKKFERITIAMNTGAGVDIDILKKGNNQVEIDQGSNVILWHVENLVEEETAVLSFSSEKIQFDDMFPLEVRFDETYSLIDANVEEVTNSATGDAMSLKLIHSLSTENYRVNAE